MSFASTNSNKIKVRVNQVDSLESKQFMPTAAVVAMCPCVLADFFCPFLFLFFLFFFLFL